MINEILISKLTSLKMKISSQVLLGLKIPMLLFVILYSSVLRNAVPINVWICIVLIFKNMNKLSSFVPKVLKISSSENFCHQQREKMRHTNQKIGEEVKFEAESRVDGVVWGGWVTGVSVVPSVQI